MTAAISPDLSFGLPDGSTLHVPVTQVVLAGYSGRTREAIVAHSREMMALGVQVPDKFPVFFSVMPCLLTQGPELQVVGVTTQSEVEFVIFLAGGEAFVTIGNDQFDLEMERDFSTLRSKNVGQKAVGREAWPLAEVEKHWDQLTLALTQEQTQVQHSHVAEILPPRQLLKLAEEAGLTLGDGLVLFSGTVTRLIDRTSAAGPLTLTLSDPLLGREISCSFRIHDISSFLDVASQSSSSQLDELHRVHHKY